MISKDYWVIRNKKTGQIIEKGNGSTAPGLYKSEGKANGKIKQFWKPEEWEAVPVLLTEKVAA